MEPYIGEIRLFGGDYAPRGWALCDGSLLSVNQYQALFTIIQTYYGGDGMTTFAVPDLRGRAPVNAGASTTVTSAYGLGQQNGSETIKLNQQQLPAHSHGIKGVTKSANTFTPEGNYLSIPTTAGAETPYSIYSDGTDTDETYGVLNNNTILPTGSGLAVSITQPVLAITFIIALEGIYPSRP